MSGPTPSELERLALLLVQCSAALGAISRTLVEAGRSPPPGQEESCREALSIAVGGLSASVVILCTSDDVDPEIVESAEMDVTEAYERRRRG